MTLELLLSVFLKLSIFMSCWLIFTRRTPSPQYFKGFKGTPSDFTSMLKQCLSDPQCSDLKSLDIPNDVYDVIAEYSIFWVALDRIMPNQEVYIEQCSDSNVVIAASKFNHLRMRQCRDMTVSFPYIMSKLELIDCTNIDIVCKSTCYTYRFDQCTKIRVTFPDPGSRVTFYCLDSSNVTFNAEKVRWRRDDSVDQESKNEEDGDEDEDENDNDYPESLQYVVPFEKDKPRWSIRWRTNNNPEFTSRVFKASYTLGTNDDPRGIF